MADSDPMATKEACEAALVALAERLDGIPDATKRRHSVDRTISCHLPDLHTTYSGRVCDGSLCDIAVAASRIASKVPIRLIAMTFL